jgi:hypothetical protein
MKYPNTRYGNPEEFRYYAQGMPIKAWPSIYNDPRNP